MRTICGKVALVIWLCGLLSLVFCGAAAQTAHVTATAEIVSPLTLSKLSDLGFGRMAVGNSEGSVTLDGAGKRTATGGVSLVEGGDVTAATFSVSGQPGRCYAVLLPQSVALHCGAETLQVDRFSHDGGQLTSGPAQMHVGATLHVAPRQPIGYYVGVFDVTVFYN
jgi:hypothetical protein